MHSQNFQHFQNLRLDQKALANQYIVIVNQKVVSTGLDIEKMLRSVRKEYPKKVPFVAKISSPEVLVFLAR